MNSWLSTSLVLAALHLIVFTGIHSLLQNESIYDHSLGLISTNYERIGGWSDFEIVQRSIPFLDIHDSNMDHWDAGLYRCIREHAYDDYPECYGQTRNAFFPLFPALWRLTHVNAMGMGIINYFIFAISISLLCFYLIQDLTAKRLLLYVTLISLPSVIIYYIPYTESLFLFTMTIATIGLLKKNYSMYFIGMMSFAMVRPAAVFILVSIVILEFVIWVQGKSGQGLFKSVLKKTLPMLIGFGLVILIQYYYTHSWTAYYEAQKAWAGSITPFDHLSDWSREGFGLSIIAISFIALPATIFVLRLIFLPRSSFTRKWVNRISGSEKQYLMALSSLYATGILLFTLLTSGGNVHSLFRFILCSPFFFILAITLPTAIASWTWRKTITWGLALCSLALILLLSSSYGGDKFCFPFFGFCLFPILLYFLIPSQRSSPLKMILLLSVIFCNMVWTAYLLNMFTSNVWLFT